MTSRQQKQDLIWKALADATRREILDVLAERALTTGELADRFDHLCRTNVMKHLDILVAANLVLVRRQGRSRWNYLNPAPIQSVCDRWVSKHVKNVASSMARLKEIVEERVRSSSPLDRSAAKPAHKKSKAAASRRPAKRRTKSKTLSKD